MSMQEGIARYRMSDQSNQFGLCRSSRRGLLVDSCWWTHVAKLITPNYWVLRQAAANAPVTEDPVIRVQSLDSNHWSRIVSNFSDLNNYNYFRLFRPVLRRSSRMDKFNCMNKVAWSWLPANFGRRKSCTLHESSSSVGQRKSGCSKLLLEVPIWNFLIPFDEAISLSL